MLLAAIALAVAAASSSGDRADRPHVVVRKDIVSSTGEYLVRGQTFKAVYSVFNLGLDDALDVRVKDDWPASNFETISGKASATWATLEGCVSRVAGHVPFNGNPRTPWLQGCK